jgi:hypothetical protein
VLGVLLLVAVLGAVAHPGRSPATAGPAGRHVGEITADERAATFAFAPDVAPYDRRIVLSAVAGARPEARGLIDAVDGLVTIEVGPTPAHAVGVTEQIGSRYSVLLNLGLAARISAQRGMTRLVLHELGHVVDGALVADRLVAQLDAEVPTAYGCGGGVGGACANPAEVFAESFAKWASGDIGVDLDLGYAVPPPADLASWGAPLAALAR